MGGVYMGKMSQADFFFGAALSVLFNNKMIPALVENGTERRIYNVMTNEGNYRIFMKYRTKPSTDNNDLSSWQFMFNDVEIDDFRNNLKESILLILICGKEELKDSEMVVLDNAEIKQAICDTGKTSITIGRRRYARNFYISMGGGRINDLLIKANRLDLIGFESA